MTLRNALLTIALPACLAANFAHAGEADVSAWTKLTQDAAQLYHNGKSDAAIDTELQALGLAEKSFGADDVRTASSASTLAMYYDNAGKLAQAEPLYKRALAIDEKSTDLRELGKCQFNLGSLYFKEQEFSQADFHLKHALETAEKLFGAESPSLIPILNRLALSSQFQSHYAQAEPYLKRVLAIQEKTAGSNDPQLAIALTNLSNAYLSMHEGAKAEEFAKRALAIQEKIVGADNPKIVIDMETVGNAYIEEKKFAEAEALYKHALEIQVKALGEKHPDVAGTYTDLAKLYWTEGKLKESKAADKKAHEILGLKFEE